MEEKCKKNTTATAQEAVLTSSRREADREIEELEEQLKKLRTQNEQKREKIRKRYYNDTEAIRYVFF